MNIKKYTVSGYARLYRSFLRFCSGLDAGSALKLTYRLYAADMESQRLKAFVWCVKEVSEAEFCDRIKQAQVTPYRTEIQFYRAMESLLRKINIPKAALSYVKAVLEMVLIMENIKSGFYEAFDMEIDDGRTVYKLCAKSLVPRPDEPGLCILQDWLDALSA